MTRKRLITALVVLLVLAWLAPAAFVMLYDPARPVRLPGEDLIPGTKASPFFPYGYMVSGGGESWEGGGPRLKTRWIAQRGVLHRKAGHFPFAVRYAVTEGAKLARITVDASITDGIWLTVATAESKDGVVAECEGVVPHFSSRFRVEAVLEGGETIGFSRAMPVAETVLGRLYDGIAYSPLFDWLPKLR